MSNYCFTVLTSVLLIAACTSESGQNEKSFTYPETIELNEIGSVIGTSEQVFGNPDYVLPIPGGEFIIADTQTLLLHLFDSDFTFQHTIGGSGDGPNEFRRFNDLSVQESSVTVYDGTRSIISDISVENGRLTLEETHDFSYTGHPDHPGAMFWRFIEGENGEHIALYYDFNITSQDPLTYHRIVAIPYTADYQPAAEDPVAVFEYNPALMIENITLSVPYLRRGLISSLNGNILFGVNNEPTVGIYNRNGDLIESIKLPDTSSDLTRDEKIEAYDQMYANSPDPERFRNDVFPHIPDQRPVVRSLLSDANQRIWVRIYTVEDEHDWIVFDHEGSPLLRLSLPDNHTFLNSFDDRVFTKRTTDSGTEIVVFEWEN